jgi:hypothetical protein
LSAVYDNGKGGYEHFPIIVFAVIEGDADGDIICGMTSSPDGLDAANLDDDFIGYWMRGPQEPQDIHEFLADHGHDVDGEASDADEDDADEDDADEDDADEDDDE